MRTVCRVWTKALVVVSGILVASNLAYGQLPQGQQNNLPGVATCVDVVLAPGGVLRGQVQSGQAAPCGAMELVLMQVGKESARTTTDRNGMFELNGVRGGAYAVSAGGATMDVRLWSEGTAPPSARDSLMVIARGDVSRGQGSDGLQGQGSDVTRGQGPGGTFWRTVTNPWVSAGLIGAAIAVPIALNNNDSGS
ncbi:MAG: hypothetical protein K8T91_02205 [Planctomycetes bacterium]|nr:hypothetical protein [Planctomycetota bacterium]